MHNYELDYLDLVNEIITKGDYRECRNGETRALFNKSLVIKELDYDAFPILTSRKIHYMGVLGELAAFVRGATTLKEFKSWGCNYWDANAAAWPRNHGRNIEDMEVGQVYGAQWVNWRGTGHNQLKILVNNLINDPHSRRHVLTTFDPLAEACLPPCHLLCQFFVDKKGRLDCVVYMRSVDVILGLPSDVVLYATLLILMANTCSMKPGELTFHMGDTHIYENHVEPYSTHQADAPIHIPPDYQLAPCDVFSFEPLHLSLRNYKHEKPIIYPFSV